jgi:hypothetical protein
MNPFPYDYGDVVAAAEAEAGRLPQVDEDGDVEMYNLFPVDG